MLDGKHCPECGNDIGFWPVFSAGLPNRIWCPWCGTRLSYADALGVFLVMLVTALVVCVGAVLLTLLVSETFWGARILVFAAAGLAVWVPLELATTWFLREYKTLAHFKPPSPDSEDAWP
jgi:hypothetical protein